MGRYLPAFLTSDAYKCPAPAAKVALFEYTTAQAVAADDDGLYTGTVGTDGATITTFLAGMPACRNITVKTAGTAGNVKAGTIKVYGTDINDVELTEDITLTEDSALSHVSAKAYKTVTKVVVPAQDGNITVKVGWGDLYGLPFLLTETPANVGSVAGVNEAVTFTVDDDELCKNTFTFSSAPAGEKVKLVLFL